MVILRWAALLGVWTAGIWFFYPVETYLEGVGAFRFQAPVWLVLGLSVALMLIGVRLLGLATMQKAEHRLAAWAAVPASVALLLYGFMLARNALS